MKGTNMKRTLLGSSIVLTSFSLLAQGTVVFNNRVAGSIITHVYAPLPNYSFSEQIGNGTADYPPGTTSWAGYTLIGTTLSGRYGAQSTFAQLLAAPGINQPEYSLVPQATAITTFRSGAAAGFICGGVTATLSNIGNDSPATLEMVAWDNSSGLYPTWTQARSAWQSGLIAAGVSGTWNTVVGGTATPPYLTGAQSFNLYPSPEPSALALAGFGVAILLITRRSRSADLPR
jgi:hypothetical protein